MESTVMIITITRGRSHLLQRAVASVQTQRYPAALIQHHILVDDCANTRAMLERSPMLPYNLSWEYASRQTEEQSGPSRLAKLRNKAAAQAKTDWVCFLDDDNEFTSNHIESLVACADASGCKAVHSHMQIFTQDGKPYLEQLLPWARNEQDARTQYEFYRLQGVYEIGSNISRDRADPINVEENPVRTVDTGEWLFARELLLRYPFPENYSENDIDNMITEDDKLMLHLIESRVPIACTGEATLKYYLGGYSNGIHS